MPPHTSPLTDLHLTDAQFTDLLLGAAPAAVSAHLAACPLCAQESARVSASIRSFDAESRLWAERRASTALPPAPHPQPLLGWPPSPRAWAASAAALIIAFSLGLVHRAEAPPAAAPAVAVSAATLQADNDLLSAIHGELQTDPAPPPSLYGLNTDTDTGTGDIDSRAAHPQKAAN